MESVNPKALIAKDITTPQKFILTVIMPMSATKTKLEDVFKKMGTNPNLIKGKNIKATGTFKYAKIEFVDHPSLLFCFHSLKNFKIDNEVLKVEIDGGVKDLDGNRVFYQYPFMYEKQYLTNDFLFKKFS
jgi:hypothetical protein